MAPARATGMPLYMAQPRGPTSQVELAITWEYPVFGAETEEGAGTRSVRQRAALEGPEAFAAIAGDDPRPLLVLRECLYCTGTDDALLTRQADNEKTMLLSRWFHCVKLPPDVLDEDHPFRNLFHAARSTNGADGADAAEDEAGSSGNAHLFVARSDGSGRIDLDGAQSRTELWAAMGELLSSEYAKKTDRALKELLRLLDKYDVLDERIAKLEDELDQRIEEDGPSSRKVKKTEKELAKARAEREALREKAAKVSELRLKNPKPAKEG